jgi:surface polysaccharide O-acyltransferase-like enzyme
MRIIAALMVVIIHSHPILTTLNPDSFTFVLSNFIESIARIAVPVFIMITGALLLNEEREFKIKDGIKKAADMFILVSIWSVIYAFATPLINGNLVLGGGWLETVIYGHYHLWYLYMLVGLYLVTPILKKITKKENANIILYYILIFTVVKGIFPLLNYSFNGITGTENWIAKYVSMFNVDHFTVFITYYLLGWYIANVEISRKSRIKIYVAGIIGFLITFVGTQLISIMNSKPNSDRTNDTHNKEQNTKQNEMQSLLLGIDLLLFGRIPNLSVMKSVIHSTLPPFRQLQMHHPIG